MPLLDSVEPRMDVFRQVVAFWVNAGRKSWFARNETFDAQIRGRFLDLHFEAARGELEGWLDHPEGALGLLLLLDQFPRNMFRGTAHAFATDPLARRVADSAIAAGHDQSMPTDLRAFFYLPFEHSEDLADQRRSCDLCAVLARDTGDPDALKWARLHYEIIERFGRFPHRNACLGRETTPQEQAFLDAGGFSG